MKNVPFSDEVDCSNIASRACSVRCLRPRVSGEVRAGGSATLFSSPGKIQLWFKERLDAKYCSASVYDPDGKRVDADIAQVSAEDPKQLSVGRAISNAHLVLFTTV